MTTTLSPSDRLASLLAGASAVSLALTGALLLGDEQSSESTTAGIEHVSLAGFSLTLLLLAALTTQLGRLAGMRRIALAPAGALTGLALLAGVSNVRGSDPAFFDAVAGAANLVWLAGWVAIATGLWRRRPVPRPLAIGLPLSWIAMIPLGPLGGPMLAAAYWLAVSSAIGSGEAGEVATAG